MQIFNSHNVPYFIFGPALFYNIVIKISWDSIYIACILRSEAISFLNCILASHKLSMLVFLYIQYLYEHIIVSTMCACCRLLTESCNGRPKLEVTKEEILQLKHLNYSWSKIAEILDVSRQTLYRRLQEFGIDSCKFTNISDQDLETYLKDIKASHSSCGEVMIQGHLIHSGVKVPRERLRAAIHHVDHTNTVARRSSVIRRRIYTTPHPNFVWHLDGNHKMIRWRLVIHAGVDGFSRLITYIKCANNNSADTVLQEFKNGVAIYGLPCSVRTDCGGENVDVWRHMLATHLDPSCVLTGSSVHNERIERLWRDVTRCVSSSFIDMFYELEGEGILDPSNEVDVFCLQVVFLPRINKQLSEFQGGWNNHLLSTEGNMSPIQLCVSGLTASNHQVNVADTVASLPNQQLDLDMENLESVEIPCNRFKPCDQLINTVESLVTPTLHTTTDGKTMYRDVIHTVGQHLQGTCYMCTLS